MKVSNSYMGYMTQTMKIGSSNMPPVECEYQCWSNKEGGANNG